VPVQCGFKVDRFQELAEDYHDKQLFELLRFGFPLDITKNFNPAKDTVNHTSAVKFPEVKKFIMTELQQGALSGLILSDEFAHIHISPLMSRPKEGDARRIIVDLSWPKAESASVNDAVLENKYLDCDFILKLPTVDHICQIINAFEVPVLIYKIDLARAFRQIPIDPLDIVNLGIKWEDNIYLNTALPFGFRHGSAICITDAVRHILSKKNITLVNYIDDFIAVVPVQCAYEMFEITKNVLGEIGLEISDSKTVFPTHVCNCLGIMINTKVLTLAIQKYFKS
jgi:hypothetical protein